MDFFRGKNWDIIGKTRLWFTISGITIVVGIAALAIHGLNLGIDFTGGTLLRYGFASEIATNGGEVSQASAKAREVLDKMGLGNSEVQVASGDDGRMNQLYLRTPRAEKGVDEETVAVQRSEQLKQGLETAFSGKGPVTLLGRETVGPVVGEELRNQALLAFGLGCILIMIYITVRYEFRFAVAAITGLIHDTLVVLGCMALFHVELNGAFVAAILTVLGYSNHDTVVIMDRIRENMRVKRQTTFAATVNTSLLETLARSVNIVGTVLFTVIALLVFGGEAIRGFSMALLFGISTGCYSSIFTAAPIVVLLENRTARARAAALAAARSGRAPTTGRPAARPAAPRATEDAEPTEATGRAGRGAIERLQREEMQERAQIADAEQEAKREERRERRKREKERTAKKGGSNKKRF